MTDHPWKLVAPWYRWRRQQDQENRPPTRTRPVFQKFDDPDFVRGFVRDPQRSLRFLDDPVTRYADDRVYAVQTEELTTSGRFRRLFVARKQGSTTDVAY